MRALLLYNPNATTTTPAVIDVITRALSADLKLDVEATKRRDHASFLAAGAVHEGYEVVLALGGDGTINEVMQGVARTDVRLGIIPGGSTNVWARTLGLPNDAVEATSVVLAKLRDREERTVNLGTANGRYFGFTAGFGYDAEAVRYVERRHRLKRAVRQVSFLYCGAMAYHGGAGGQHRWSKSQIALSVDGRPSAQDLRSAVCCNSNPFTYLGPWPAQMCPDAELERALDLAGLTRISFLGLARIARTALGSMGVGRLRSVRLWHDHAAYDLVSATPLALQLDGDFVGETTRVELRSVPRALKVVA
ncbi:MAG: diacylglycerol/lipid kinase family protein [Egibacteraceae bacterium]